jgi:hypothetical protein
LEKFNVNVLPVQKNNWWMKYLGVLMMGFILFFSCVSVEERRLQTDQSFEGEEMFNISYSLDEHISYAFRPLAFYMDTLNYPVVPGCPEIILIEENKQVRLLFGNSECPTNTTGKNGVIILTYLDSLFQENLFIRMEYEDYQVRGVTLEGERYVEVDSILPGIYQDRLSGLIVKDAQQSSSKINADFTHQIVFTDSLQQIITSGSASGRNLAGRPFKMEILQDKRFFWDCVGNGFYVPASGEESWTFERTNGFDVNHRIDYSQDPECNHTATIQLDDGREINKTQ